MKTKKLINAGADAVDEMLQGIMAAHPRQLYAVEDMPRAIIARNGPR
ncbi:dihydroxyacetone kinase, partial [Rhizobium ruizarguesonis]